MRPAPLLRVLTWHVHGGYLYYLSQGGYELYLPVKPGRPEGYGGRSSGFPWPENVHEVPAERVRELPLDCVLFQSRKNYFEDQFEVLSPAQQRLPRIYLEHDPPLAHPTDTRHPVDDPDVLLVHVTAFNELMWDCGRTPTTVVRHGVTVPAGAVYSGELPRGIAVVNNLYSRGRRTGPDVFDRVRRELPVDLAGMGSERGGGLGDIPLERLPFVEARHRFFFNPIRYTSLGLAVCEAMMLGMPVVGLATTEMVKAAEDGVSGFVDTDVSVLISRMRELLADAGLAAMIGAAARDRAIELFHIDRFARDWLDVFVQVAGSRRDLVSAGSSSGKEER